MKANFCFNFQSGERSVLQYMKSSRQFWLIYAAAWLAYGASLGAVFVGVGNRLNAGLLLTVLSNVAPAALLGVAVVFICRKLKWGERREPQFILIHSSLLAIFTVS